MSQDTIENVPVPVSAEDIAVGEAGDCTGCPLARAGNRFLAHSCQMSVGLRTYSITCVDPSDFDRFEADLPRDAVSFVADFDADEDVEPRTIVMPIPRRFLRRYNT